MERWCELFQDECRRRGIRATSQRLAVYRVLAADLDHPTAEAIWERLRPDLPSLSQATVYRILDSLERERLVRRVSTTGGVARYDANQAAHQHLVCRLCGRMIDINAPSLSAAKLPSGPLSGFFAEELDIRVLGRCRECVHNSRRTGPKVPQSHTRRMTDV